MNPRALVDAGDRVDLLVEGVVDVERRTIDKLLPIYEAQLLTYLKLSGKRVGLLLDFIVVHLRDGIKRRVPSCPTHSSSSAFPSVPLCVLSGEF